MYGEGASVAGGYNSYTGRLTDELGHYDWENPLDGAAALNRIFWKGFYAEALLADGARAIDGSTDPVEPHRGLFAETREATVGAIGKLFEGKPIQGLVQAANVVGAAAIDVGDLITLTDHGQAA